MKYYADFTRRMWYRAEIDADNDDEAFDKAYEIHCQMALAKDLEYTYDEWEQDAVFAVGK